MPRKHSFGLVAAVLCATTLLVACGGGGAAGGGTDSPPGASGPPPTTISGIVAKGPVAGAMVTAYCGGQSAGTVFGTATTDSNGNYNISSTSACAQPIELVATTSSQSTELDEVNAESVPANFTLKAYLASPGSANTIHITPLTDIVAAVIDAQSGSSSPPTSERVNSVTNAFIANVLSGDAATYSATPMLLAQAAASNDQAVERLASILTAISAQANWSVSHAPRIRGVATIDLPQATAQALLDLENDATGSSSSGAAAPDWPAVAEALAGGVAEFWYGNYALDPAATTLRRLAQSTPQLSPPAAGPSTYPVGGTVTGLTSGGLVLQSNFGEDLPVSGNGPFTFADALSTGTMYAVHVGTQPSGQSCSVADGFGSIAGAAISGVTVTCVPAYTVGGSVTGLDAGASVTLANVNGETVSISANGTFSFPTALTTGSPYAVSVSSQPEGERCTLTAPSSVVGNANITNVNVSCADTFNVDLAVSGLGAGGSLTVELTGGGLQESVTATQDGTVTFPAGLTSGTLFTMSVTSFPAGQGCSFSGYDEYSDTVSGQNFVVNPVPLQCKSGYFTIGGSVSGLAPGSTLVLEDATPLAAAGHEMLTISANGPYTFVTPVAGMVVTSGQPPTYQVTFAQQPPDQNCTWAYGAGGYSVGSYPLPANVTQLNVVCTAAEVLSGKVLTLAGSPVSTGMVIITGTAPFPGSSSDSKTAYFNADGSFELPVPPGTYTVAPDTDAGLTVFSPASQSVVVGNSTPAAVSFTCVSGCPADTVTNGGGVGTSTGGSGSGGSAGSGGGTSGSGGGTVSCGFSSCAAGLPTSCVSISPDPNEYDWYSFTNTCSEPIDVTYTVPNSPYSGSLFTMDLNPGASGNTGLSATDAPYGFFMAVCPYEYTAWSPTSNAKWDGAATFICAPTQ